MISPHRHPTHARHFALLAIGLLGGYCQAAYAVCQVSTSGVTFGIYDPLVLSPTVALGSINVGCSPLPLVVTISLSGGGSGNPASRRMIAGTTLLPYNLYQDAIYSNVYGDGSSGSSTGVLLSGVLPVLTSSVVYGRMPAGANVGAGSYTDSITVTITF